MGWNFVLFIVFVFLIYGYIIMRLVDWKYQAWRATIGCPQPQLLDNGVRLLEFPGDLLHSPLWKDNTMKNCSWNIECQPEFNCAISCSIYNFSTNIAVISLVEEIRETESTPPCYWSWSNEQKWQRIVLYTHTRNVDFRCRIENFKRPEEPCFCGRRNYTNWSKQESQSERNNDLVKKFPVVAAVVSYKQNSSYITKKEYVEACSATIISTHHVLTLTTCYLSLGNAPKIVVVGVEDLKKGPLSSKQEYKIEAETTHPDYLPLLRQLNHSIDYNYVPVEYDFLLLRVASYETQIDFTNVSPACLPRKFSDYNFKNGAFTYLGYNRNLKLSRIDYKHCDKNNTIWIEDAKRFLGRLCVEFVNYSGENVSIGGGGPLLYEDPTTNGLLYIVAVVVQSNLRPREDPHYNIPNYAALELLYWIQKATNVHHCEI